MIAGQNHHEGLANYISKLTSMKILTRHILTTTSIGSLVVNSCILETARFRVLKLHWPNRRLLSLLELRFSNRLLTQKELSSLLTTWSPTILSYRNHKQQGDYFTKEYDSSFPPPPFQLPVRIHLVNHTGSGNGRTKKKLSWRRGHACVSNL